MITTTISKLHRHAETLGEVVSLTTQNLVFSSANLRRGMYKNFKGETIYGWVLDTRGGAPALPITNPDYPVQIIEPLHH